MQNDIELCGQGSCYGDGAHADYAWTERGWLVEYFDDGSGAPLGTDRSIPGHPSLALLRLEHEAAVIETVMSVLWE